MFREGSGCHHPVSDGLSADTLLALAEVLGGWFLGWPGECVGWGTDLFEHFLPCSAHSSYVALVYWLANLRWLRGCV